MRYFTDSPFERMMMQVPRSCSVPQPDAPPGCTGCTMRRETCGKPCKQEHIKEEPIKHETCDR